MKLYDFVKQLIPFSRTDLLAVEQSLKSIMGDKTPENGTSVPKADPAAQEAEFIRRHGKPPAGNAVSKHLMRRDRKYFDSGDYSMVKAQSANQANLIAQLPKRGLSPSTSPKESPQTSPRDDKSDRDLQLEAAVLAEKAEDAFHQNTGHPAQ
jgi:hypothetical protein